MGRMRGGAGETRGWRGSSVKTKSERGGTGGCGVYEGGARSWMRGGRRGAVYEGGDYAGMESYCTTGKATEQIDQPWTTGGLEVA